MFCGQILSEQLFQGPLEEEWSPNWYNLGSSAFTAQNESLAPAGIAPRENVAVQPAQSWSMIRKRFKISARISKESEIVNAIHS